MAGRKINCGKFWTLLSTECFICNDCKTCIYERYCTNPENRREGKPIAQIVVGMLLQKFGEPPEKFLDEARDSRMNPKHIEYLKKIQH